MDEIGEDLFALAALEVHRLAVGGEYIEVAEALYLEQGIFFGYDGESELAELLFDRLLCDGLHDISACPQPHGVAGVL